MSDIMRPIPFANLMTWILSEYKREGTVFGVRPYSCSGYNMIRVFDTHADRNPDTGSVRPCGCDSTSSQPHGVHPPEALPHAKHGGELLETPFGPAAGPHTQLAQNIIAAYAAGARFFELKTVQIMDGEELSACVNKPCIIAYDEGYNCEWSTELTVPQAYDEYVKAWFACKLLAVEYDLGHPDGFVFNMSVGYDLKGIQSEKIDRFIEGMKDASASAVWKECADWTLAHLSSFANIDEAYVRAISPRVSSSITESTLHGCPPDEIERIATYLLTEKGLHTYVKCNPTLLGYDFARKRLNALGYDYIVFDDHHFKEDLQWEDAVPMLQRLLALGKEKQLAFGVKLTNTFPVDVTRGELPSEEMYMSGRSLYVLTVELAKRLSEAFEGTLPVSWSGGADVTNILPLLDAGIRPVTMATTLLKPGGYARLSQIAACFAEEGASSLPAQIDVPAVAALSAAAETDPYYKKPLKPLPSRKIKEKVPLLDCFTAPCSDGCPIHQDIPAYLAAVDAKDYTKALQIILERNPLPFITGTICPHTCGNKCMRNHYESAVDIRGAKLTAAECAFDAVSRLPRQTMVPLRSEESRLPACCMIPSRSGFAEHSAEPVVSAPWRTSRSPESMTSRGAADEEPSSYRTSRSAESMRPPGASEATLPEKQRVAIIGGGPAGIAAAAFLTRAGVPVTIFEKTDALGGVVRHVIPDFRIAAEAIDNDIALSLPEIISASEEASDGSANVQLKLNTEITDPLSLLSDGYTDVIIAAGAWAHGTSPLEYGDAVNSLDFLREMKHSETGAPGGRMDSGERLVRHEGENLEAAAPGGRMISTERLVVPWSRDVHIVSASARNDARSGSAECPAQIERSGNIDRQGRRLTNIAVIGGGNTAMDCARAAKRLEGVEEVSIVYRRDAHNMPADEEELQMALADGVTFRALLAPVGVKDGMLECKVMKLGAPDESGRRAPEDTGERTTVKADLVIAATGEQIDPALYRTAGCALDDRNRPVLDENLQTSVPHIYAAGDCKAGPATVVKAIADAQTVARAISGITFDHYESTNIAAEEDTLRARHGLLRTGELSPGAPGDFMPSDERRIRHGAETTGSAECPAKPERSGCMNHRGSRNTTSGTACLGCATVCEACAEVCPNRANIAVRVPGMARTQIVHIDGMCNECGNCAVFCPYESHPYKDKFTLFWSREDFENSENEGFLPLEDDRITLRLNGNTRECSLSDATDIPQDLIRLMQAARDANSPLHQIFCP